MTTSNTPHSAFTPDDIRAVSPALANYTQKSIVEDLWNRPGYSLRSRGLFPFPGTTKLHRLEDVEFINDDLSDIGRAAAKIPVKGLITPSNWSR